jgi:hypothetical protein
MRPVVSYDDITLPYQSTDEPQVSSSKPPSKKRKKSKPSTRKNTGCEEGIPASFASDDDGYQDKESRELTHDEIWDDSALIDAWNAATEEYEVSQATFHR